MAFTIRCRKTGEYIQVPGDRQDYSPEDLQNICYGHRTWSNEPKTTFLLDDQRTDQKFAIAEPTKDAVDVP